MKVLVACEYSGVVSSAFRAPFPHAREDDPNVKSTHNSLRVQRSTHYIYWRASQIRNSLRTHD